MAGYTKLFSDIVDSSIWDESPETCKVWVTLLAMSDSGGFVRGSEGWLAAKSKVSLGKVVLALNKFQEPDLDSRTPDNEGRRIQVVPHGWLILNYTIFRDRLGPKDPHRTAYQREWMRKKRQKDTPEASNCQHLSTLSTPVNPASASVYASVSMDGGTGEGKPDPTFTALETRLLTMYKRPITGMVYEEQQTVFNVSRRPDVIAELAELEVFRSKPDCFFPQSLRKLLNEWQYTLDRARAYQPKRDAAAERLAKNAWEQFAGA